VGEAGVAAFAGPGQNFVYLSSEMSFDGKVVKGAPYSAQTVRTFTQTLSDGNHISRQSGGAIYRDSEGRTRRETAFGNMGSWSAQNDAPQTIFINDPVANVNYVLNPNDHTAVKMTFNTSSQVHAAVKGSIDGSVDKETADAIRKSRSEIDAMKRARVVAGGPGAPPLQMPDGPATTMIMKGGDLQYFAGDKSNVKTEDLGTQSFDGVDAQGTRTTMTIPAGKIGNEAPIQIVDERWYSPDLQVVVMTRHNDPQSGETIYKLTNVNRGEQPASLFTVPSDYTMKDEPATLKLNMIERRRHSSGDEQQQQQ
ncbi:MAG: hypothetical protein ACREAC_24130, partial [Blastocatellia bacterium]